jgi:hypothetical protein
MEGRQRLREDGLVWVVVLATEGESDEAVEGEGHTDGEIPAVYRSMDDAVEVSPLQQSLRRAKQIAPRERICVVVANEHRQWWRDPLWFLPASNVIAQPGSAAIAQGVSESMRKILERDGAAQVVLLPAADRTPGAGIVKGTASTVLDLVKRHWPRGVDDVHSVGTPLACS